MKLFKRLTKRDENGNVVKVKSSRDTYICTILEEEEKYNAEILNRLAEYEEAEAAGLIKRLPCKEGTPIYYIRKDCDENWGYKEKFRPTKEFKEDCEHFESQYWESPEYCKYFDKINDGYRDYEYCSLDLKIICDKCKDRLTIHKDYFTLSMINKVYNTPQFNPNTKLKDTYFLTVEEAEEKIEELKNGKVQEND